MKIAVIYIRLGQPIWWSQEIIHLGKKKWKHDFYHLTKLSVDITSMYFSLKNDKRASTGMDKGLHLNLMSFNLMNDNHTIHRTLKIHSLDRFDDLWTFVPRQMWLFSGRRSCQCCKGPEDATIYSGKGENDSLNSQIRLFKTSVTFN